MRTHPHLDAVGVELEGGWDAPVPEELHRFWQYDGSVHVSARHSNGELAIGPYRLFSVLADKIQLGYPHHVNETCGLHVHMSTKTLAGYAALMEPQYQRVLLRALRLWARQKNRIADRNPAFQHVPANFWDRIQGYNDFCRLGGDPDLQAAQRGKNSCRYYAVNACYGLHKTIEIRVLPMFPRAPDAVEAVRVVLNSTNHFLHRRNRAAECEIVTLDINMPNPRTPQAFELKSTILGAR